MVYYNANDGENQMKRKKKNVFRSLSFEFVFGVFEIRAYRFFFSVFCFAMLKNGRETVYYCLF